MDRLNILTENQYGFRKDHSTSLALLDLYNKISSGIDIKEFTVGIFLDLSKAFDTIDHCILFDKLQHYGIRGVPLDWFKSYFNERQQFVVYNDISSQKIPINCGVPQGSILGPLLFLLYINDICNASDILHYVLFADDTNLFYSHKNLSFLIDQVNHELLKLSDWFAANRLSINFEKTKFMIFRPKQKSCNVDVNIVLSSHQISLTNEVSFLGVILDEHLSWKSHITHVTRKMSKSISIIKKASFYLSKSTLHVNTILFSCLSIYAILYFSLGINVSINPKTYCLIVLLGL